MAKARKDAKKTKTKRAKKQAKRPALSDPQAPIQSTPTKAVGLRCPRCGCADFSDPLTGRPWRTIKTVPSSGFIRRYKVCRYCGRRIRTRETVEQD